jgi:hypothetical protein
VHAEQVDPQNRDVRALFKEYKAKSAGAVKREAAMYSTIFSKLQKHDLYDAKPPSKVSGASPAAGAARPKSQRVCGSGIATRGLERSVCLSSGRHRLLWCAATPWFACAAGSAGLPVCALRVSLLAGLAGWGTHRVWLGWQEDLVATGDEELPSAPAGDEMEVEAEGAEGGAPPEVEMEPAVQTSGNGIHAEAGAVGTQ